MTIKCNKICSSYQPHYCKSKITTFQRPILPLSSGIDVEWPSNTDDYISVHPTEPCPHWPQARQWAKGGGVEGLSVSQKICCYVA
jgi:hypothetical protein